MEQKAVAIYYTMITVEEAKVYLGENFYRNRNLRRKRVNQYAQDMKDGRWNPYAAEPISISDTGKLLNGQHRLAAVVEAGIPLYTEMRVGVPEETYKYYDCGLNRSPIDGIPNDVKNKSTVIGACRAAIAIGAIGGEAVTSASFGHNYACARFVSNASVCDFYYEFRRQYPGMLEEAGEFARTSAIRSAKWTPKSVAISAIAMMIVDREMFTEFRDAIADDTNTMVSVLAYKKWANDHSLKGYGTDERCFIEWCAAANIWAELHGHAPRKIAYKKGVTGELIGFRPEMFDLLGNKKSTETED